MIILEKSLKDVINSEELIIDYPKLDYYSWKRLFEFNSDDDICNILNDYLKKLDCSIVYDCGRAMMTTFGIYNDHLSYYIYYLDKLINQFTYNKYLNKLINRHINNLIFEKNNPLTNNIVSKKKDKSRTKKQENKFVKIVTKDLFTDEEIYIYNNPVTHEVIKSTNPNMLEELNAPKKKVKNKIEKPKSIGVPISSMTFSFKKK